LRKRTEQSEISSPKSLRLAPLQLSQKSSRIHDNRGNVTATGFLCTNRNTHYDAASRYGKLFAELGGGSLAVDIALVVLIPFLRKLITDKAETAPAVAPTPAGSAAAAV
jgi:hypothetical protein